MVSMNENIAVEDHEQLGVSMKFEMKYGMPCYYTDFIRLVNTKFTLSAIPKIRDFDSLIRKENSSTFLSFCKMVDNKTRENNLAPFARREMETAWVWLAFKLYEKQCIPKVHINQANANLENVLKMRFHPKGRIEMYWQEKQKKHGWTDEQVERLEEGCDELGDEEEDLQADEDEEMLNLEEHFEGLSVGLTVEYLEFGASKAAKAA
ncbi:hypothetical protein IFR05_001852 [Cadophora sp. M221]|nr:hypothetical protein IFR05_001852 [Cadophora sp. M221]